MDPGGARYELLASARVTSFVVVAGTDTGVGKTYVTAALARALVAAGRRTLAIKPVETGCAGEEPAATEDGAVLAEASGQRAPRGALVRLRVPVTPALAADLEGTALDVDALVAQIRALAADASAEVVLVEGAGGLRSPISWTRDLSDIARALGATCLLVASDRLGTLNHVHLSVEALGREGLPVAAVVLSAPPEPDRSTGTNASALRKKHAPPLRIVEAPRSPTPKPSEIWLSELLHELLTRMLVHM